MRVKVPDAVRPRAGMVPRKRGARVRKPDALRPRTAPDPGHETPPSIGAVYSGRAHRQLGRGAADFAGENQFEQRFHVLRVLFSIAVLVPVR